MSKKKNKKNYFAKKIINKKTYHLNQNNEGPQQL